MVEVGDKWISDDNVAKEAVIIDSRFCCCPFNLLGAAVATPHSATPNASIKLTSLRCVRWWGGALTFSYEPKRGPVEKVWEPQLTGTVFCCSDMLRQLAVTLVHVELFVFFCFFPTFNVENVQLSMHINSKMCHNFACVHLVLCYTSTLA